MRQQQTEANEALRNTVSLNKDKNNSNYIREEVYCLSINFQQQASISKHETEGPNDTENLCKNTSPKTNLLQLLKKQKIKITQ